MRVLCKLNESPSSKSIVLLLTSLSEAETKSFEAGNANVGLVLPFCETVLKTNPSAFALVLAEKSAYVPNDYDAIANAPGADYSVAIAENDIYLRYLAHFESPHKLNFIKPCTLVHIRKYLSVPFVKVIETPELYSSVVVPYIQTIPASRTAWIEKIIKHEAEADDILLEGEGFVVAPDSKWDHVTVANLYLLVIATNNNIKCLRDLKGHLHINFLQNIKKSVEELVFSKYGIKGNSLRMFIHYQPSYYHFHIHVVNAQMEPNGGMAAGQAHLVEDVIDNLTLDSEFYARKTLSYFLPESHELVALLNKSAE